VAEALATAPWGRAAVFSDTGLAVANAVVFEEAYSVDWSGVDPGDLPANGLSSITPLLDQQGYIVGTANDLIRDGALSSLAYSAGSGGLYQLLWDGAQFNASYIGETTSSAAGKIVNLAQHYDIDDESARSIGYGALGLPPAPYTVIPSIRAETVVLDMGVGATDPVGWQWPGFDASAWTAAVLPAVPISLSGAETMGASVPNEPVQTIHLLRQAIAIPAGRIVRARMTLKVDDFGAFFLNGAALTAGEISEPGGNVNLAFTVELDPAAFTAGTAILATRLRNGPFVGGSPMSVAYLVEINYEL
jgi:hypothetical protein